MDYQIIGGDNSTTLGFIRTLGEAGIPVRAVIIRRDHPFASKSRYLSECTMVDSIEEGYRVLLRMAKKRKSREKVILLVDGDAYTTYLDDRYDVLSKYYIYNQAAGNIRKYNYKYEQILLAAKHGLNAPRTLTVKKGEIPEGLQYPVITKATSAIFLRNWKSESYVCRSESELKEAYKKIKSEEILIQQFIRKKNEYVMVGYCVNRGKDVSICFASNHTYLVHGHLAYSFTVKDFHGEKIKRFITEVMTEIGYEGMFDVEYMLGEDGRYYFLELNLRSSGLTYAATVAGMPMPILWAEAMVKGKTDPESVKKIKKGFVTVLDIEDFVYRVRWNRMPFLKWLAEYMRADCRLYLGRKDVVPMIWLVSGMAVDSVKRVLGNLPVSHTGRRLSG
ncbi:MAG: ATP-grasp domain-containing protein [Lachnospiraceae bacterium]|nr:ATP-grasp domain-containing protein [Lachnospiraceae bacterium]